MSRRGCNARVRLGESLKLPNREPRNVAAAMPAFLRLAVFAWSVGVLPFANSAHAMMTVQDRPANGKLGLYISVDTSRASPGQVTRQVDAEESASALRKRAKGSNWIGLTDRPADADIRLTLTGRRKDPNQGYVLSYILEAGDYKSAAEFSFEGGTEITGGVRTLGSDGRTNNDGRRLLSWDELARQFAKSLDGFAKANYDRILRHRSK